MFKTLRSKVFAFLSSLMVVSLIGVGLSFWITQRVNARLSEINSRSVPMQRELTQLSADTELLKREFERSLGFSHWSDARWKPKKIPSWALEIHRTTLERIQKEDLNTKPWQDWYERVHRLNADLSSLGESLYMELTQKNLDGAALIYPDWMKQVEILQKEVDWAKREMDSDTRNAFREAQDQVHNLRFVLQVLLLVVVGVALVVLWLGERALRPIGALRAIVKQINDRGVLTSKERAGLPPIALHQKDEVSELAREFHQMATTLIEREKTIDHQKLRLEEQNQTLLEMGELQKRLQQAEHLAAVGRLSAQVAHEVGNPLHSIGLESELALEILERLERNGDALAVKHSLKSITGSVERLQKIIQNYLKLSRLTPGVKRQISIPEVIESVLATYANSVQQMGVRVRWEFDSSSGLQSFMTEGDPELLEYALGNLVRNSLQALEQVQEGKRSLEILLKRIDQSKIGIELRDSGPGIPDSVRANLFKPFFTTKAQGTGLGLSFVKKVFSEMGGDFTLLPKSLAPGAAFLGVLPQFSLNENVDRSHEVSV